MGIAETLHTKVLNSYPNKRLDRLEITRDEALLLADEMRQLELADGQEVFRSIEDGTMNFMDVPLVIVPNGEPKTGSLPKDNGR